MFFGTAVKMIKVLHGMMTPEEMAEDIDRMAHLSNSDSIKSFTREKLVPRLDSVPRKCPNCKNSAK